MKYTHCEEHTDTLDAPKWNDEAAYWDFSLCDFHTMLFGESPSWMIGPPQMLPSSSFPQYYHNYNNAVLCLPPLGSRDPRHSQINLVFWQEKNISCDHSVRVLTRLTYRDKLASKNKLYFTALYIDIYMLCFFNGISQPIKSLDTLSHWIEWENVCKRFTFYSGSRVRYKLNNQVGEN